MHEIQQLGYLNSQALINPRRHRGWVDETPLGFSENNSRTRRGSRISARGGRQGNDDLIWDENERFLTYANTDLQLFNMLIAILCLNGVEQPFKRHQCPFFLPLRRGNPRLRRGSFRPEGWAPAPASPPPWIRACEWIGRSSRNLVYLTIEQFYTFPGNFKSVPTMTFDL